MRGIHFRGIRYKYDIISTLRNNKFYVIINAIHKQSHRTSTINTVNPILAELNIPESDIKFKESLWEVSKREATALVKTTKQLLSDRDYLKYLEKILDEDRSQGEWENFFNDNNN